MLHSVEFLFEFSTNGLNNINIQENSLTFVHQLIPVTACKTTECTELLPLIVMLSE